MTAQELYNHIVKYMTPEQALLKLLENQIGSYDKLKNGLPLVDGDDCVSPLFIIVAAAMDNGWAISFETNFEHIRGIVVGTDEFIDKHIPIQSE